VFRKKHPLNDLQSACDEAVYLSQIAVMPSHVSAIEMWGHYQ